MWIGILRFVATLSAAIIATGILHIFMMPTAWYIAFFLGCACAFLCCFCVIATVIVWGLKQPEIDWATEEWIAISDGSEIAVFEATPESPESLCIIEREIDGELEFLSNWNVSSLFDDNCIRRDWFTSDLQQAIVFDSVQQAIKVAQSIYLFDQLHKITVRSFNQRIFDNASNE